MDPCQGRGPHSKSEIPLVKLLEAHPKSDNQTVWKKLPLFSIWRYFFTPDFFLGVLFGVIFVSKVDFFGYILSEMTHESHHTFIYTSRRRCATTKNPWTSGGSEKKVFPHKARVGEIRANTLEALSVVKFGGSCSCEKSYPSQLVNVWLANPLQSCCRFVSKKNLQK